MKSWFKGVVAVAVAVWLAGCAGPKFDAVQGRLPPIAEGKGRIYFYQPQPVNAAASQQKLRVNDVVVGRNKPGSFFFIDRPAGAYRVTSVRRSDDGVNVMLAPGQTQYVRLMAEAYGGTGAAAKLSMQVVDAPEAAKNEMQDLRYWGAASPERRVRF
ncbi:MAG: DUF2846 domain-containing protein [Achromobacter sp.]|uniref:DUF2846 domain-containing protein n=1 Tax=Achromobacter TaxID=222 RepID=UPI00067FCFAE|nr:DUF2846 domain-containing protein [Achromobacter piechaudii]KNY10355.1 hypothetical protein AKG08_11625 [Achromobacter piechaudii]MPS78050.1 DUF2846 domain-containing protein [Achromobacter sp.]